MDGLWSSLIPLGVASAVVPVQMIITVLLLRSGASRLAAVAWVAGMTTVRLAQGVVFGLILGASDESGTPEGPGLVVSLLLLVLGIVLLVAAARQLIEAPDEDAPPPKWMAMFHGATPGKAYALGVGMVTVGAKFWVFTLGAIAAIGDAALGQGASVITFLLFVVLAECTHIGLVVFAYAVPDRAEAALTRFTQLLTDNNRVIMIAVGLVFGTWFLVKGLHGLGVL